VSNRFSGSQGRGAKRKIREQKRLEARERQEAFNDLVARSAEKQGITPDEARKQMKNRGISPSSVEVA
jgi:hypothetical protein